jgi:hypothetical protein
MEYFAILRNSSFQLTNTDELFSILTSHAQILYQIEYENKPSKEGRLISDQICTSPKHIQITYNCPHGVGRCKFCATYHHPTTNSSIV